MTFVWRDRLGEEMTLTDPAPLIAEIAVVRAEILAQAPLCYSSDATERAAGIAALAPLHQRMTELQAAALAWNVHWEKEIFPVLAKNTKAEIDGTIRALRPIARRGKCLKDYFDTASTGVAMNATKPLDMAGNLVEDSGC